MRKKLFIVTLLAAALTSAVPAAAAMPASGELDDSQVASITQNCAQAQATLRNLQKRDTVLRINRGRLYDMTLRQTGAFVARLNAHKVEAPRVKELDSAIRSEYQKFILSYDRYGDSLNAVIILDCKQKPHEFYEGLAQVADDRRAVADNVATIKQKIGEYSSELTALRDQEFPEKGAQ